MLLISWSSLNSDICLSKWRLIGSTFGLMDMRILIRESTHNTFVGENCANCRMGIHLLSEHRRTHTNPNIVSIFVVRLNQMGLDTAQCNNRNCLKLDCRPKISRVHAPRRVRVADALLPLRRLNQSSSSQSAAIGASKLPASPAGTLEP